MTSEAAHAWKFFIIEIILATYYLTHHTADLKLSERLYSLVASLVSMDCTEFAAQCAPEPVSGPAKRTMITFRLLDPNLCESFLSLLQ